MPRIDYRWTVGVLAGLAGLFAAAPADGQIIKKIVKTAKQAAERETLSQIDQLVAGKIRCVFDDLTCIERARRDGEEVVLTDDAGEVLVDGEGKPVSDPTKGAELASRDEMAPGKGVWANYDFVPGETVLFYEDYANDNVGDFPRRMEFVNGNWDIVEWQGRRLLRNTGPRGSAIKITLPEELPERFTIELEVYLSHLNHQLIVGTTMPREGHGWASIGGNVLKVGAAPGTGVEHYASGGAKSIVETRELENSLTPIRLMVDDTYAKTYVRERRVANVPNATFARSSTIYIENPYAASDDQPIYLGSIRIAAGGADLYGALERDGRVATQGILFGTGSDRIRPESTPTLSEIGKMLRDHAELSLLIEGHTDSDGEEAFNQGLSERRAAAVKAYLLEQFGVDPGRLETAGFGESRPVTDNGTPEGKQQNRRVELVRR